MTGDYIRLLDLLNVISFQETLRYAWNACDLESRIDGCDVLLRIKTCFYGEIDAFCEIVIGGGVVWMIGIVMTPAAFAMRMASSGTA